MTELEIGKLEQSNRWATPVSQELDIIDVNDRGCCVGSGGEDICDSFNDRVWPCIACLLDVQQYIL